ncbi:uncharacterized protein [Tursiops truncatus]|uniref:uncharacterized protein n=1 Tax=Tursiops truncatus TaxID=9739 RepID=UPI003CCEFCB0
MFFGGLEPEVFTFAFVLLVFLMFFVCLWLRCHQPDRVCLPWPIDKSSIFGNSSSTEPTTDFHEPIQALLRDRGLKLSHRTISRLLQDIESEGKCEEIIQRGRKALSMCQDSASENEQTGTTVDRPEIMKREKRKQKEKQETVPGLYPILDEFKELYLFQDELNPREENRMMEAAGRIFGNVDEAMPLVKQLVYEQCTKECRRAITPYKGKGIETWMKACREIGGPLSNTGLAAAVLAAAHSVQNPAKSGVCFQCGKPGHIKKQCKNAGARPKMLQAQRVPGTCPRCKKGKHWANECRSVKDINGQPIQPAAQVANSRNIHTTNSKNGITGPRSQGPKIFGAHESVNLQPLRPQGEPRQAPQGWTSAPAPEWY